MNKLIYPACILISMGVSAGSIRKQFVFLQYACFIAASLIGLLGLKYFVFHYLLGMYFGPLLILVNIFFWWLIFSVSLVTNRQVARIAVLNLTVLDRVRGELN